MNTFYQFVDNSIEYMNSKIKNRNCQERISSILDNKEMPKLDRIDEINSLLKYCPGENDTKLLTLKSKLNN